MDILDVVWMLPKPSMFFSSYAVVVRLGILRAVLLGVDQLSSPFIPALAMASRASDFVKLPWLDDASVRVRAL